MKILFTKATELLSSLAPEPQSRYKTILAGAVLTSFGAFAQQPTQQQDTITHLDEVLVMSVRAGSNTPVTFSNVSKEELAPRNLGQDIPSLLNYLPSVVTTTDAGNGIGYSSIRVRGADASRVNVTINGIPYNDAESQGTYWVDMPDFASSAQNIQLQRGVGTSTNGAGAFGGSLNVLTDSYKTKAEGEIANSFGSYNSRKHTVKFSSGLMNDHFELAGRLSNIESDGYIDRASSSLKSYFLQGTYVGATTLIKALVFGGTEKTYQAWNGIDAATLAQDRTFNYSGMYTDPNGNTRFYENETDNYWQDHYQLHWNERLNANWSTNVALHYTKGKGYYENYNAGAGFTDYGLQPVVVNGTLVTNEDLITRKWLDNDFYGTTFSANYKNDALSVIVGGAWNKYEGGHYGQVIWARYMEGQQPYDHYYDDDAVKTDFNVYAKANYNVTDKLGVYADVQYRTVNYTADGVLADPVDDTFNFVNPKAGLTYALSGSNTLYFSYGRGNKEPRRDDYENGSNKPESLNDFELGWRYNTGNTAININGYYMRYKDQLVLTGQLNDVGAPVYTNSGDSYRMGLEADATITLGSGFALRPNIAVSANKNLDFYTEGDSGPQSLGDTQIAFSPNVIGANQIIFHKNGWFAMLATKYVGEQYMDNLETPDAKLKAYTTTDLNVAYTFKPKAVFTEITVSGLVNNIFDEEYSSNGYYYDGPYYYPQAGTNFLAGLTLKF